MIIGYIGDPGSGKTLSAIKDIVDTYADDHYKIYSNIKIKSLKYTSYTLKDLMEWSTKDEQFDNALILLDEAHIFMDSRTSMMKKNRIVSYFLLQTRKKHVQLFWTTQYPDQVDKRLRNVSDIEVICYKTNSKDYFKNVLSKKSLGQVISKNRIYQGTPYYKYYDTNEVVKMPRE